MAQIVKLNTVFTAIVVLLTISACAVAPVDYLDYQQQLSLKVGQGD